MRKEERKKGSVSYDFSPRSRRRERLSTITPGKEGRKRGREINKRGKKGSAPCVASSRVSGRKPESPSIISRTGGGGRKKDKEKKGKRGKARVSCNGRAVFFRGGKGEGLEKEGEALGGCLTSFRRRKKKQSQENFICGAVQGRTSPRKGGNSWPTLPSQCPSY